ncbi:hypothetical protein Aperf_G00000092100 [Anoplocephala perfoliata]
MSLFLDDGHNSQSMNQSSSEVKNAEPHLLVARQSEKLMKSIPKSEMARIIIRKQHKHLLQCLRIATIQSSPAYEHFERSLTLTSIRSKKTPGRRMTLAMVARGSLSSFLSFGSQHRHATPRASTSGGSVRSKRNSLFSLCEQEPQQHEGELHHLPCSPLHMQHQHHSSLSRGPSDSDLPVDQVEKGEGGKLEEEEGKKGDDRIGSLDHIYQQNHRRKEQSLRTKFKEDVVEISKED